MTNVILQVGGIIPTNTAAFKAYALGVLLSNANFLTEQWQLDATSPITATNVTRSAVKPSTNGLEGGIEVDGRYGFGVSRGRFDFFEESKRCSKTFVYSRDEDKDSWVGMTNLLTLEQAITLARDKIHKLGIDETRFGLVEPTTAAQWKYDSNGVVYPVPLYVVRWQTTTGDYFVIDMEISGVTSNVCVLHYNLPAERLPSRLRVPMPTNYLQMLGLPTNVTFLPHDWERRQRMLIDRTPEPPIF